MSYKPRVNILLATYNGEEYLEQQLESLEKQSYNNFCCYMHDDGSTDRTPDIIKKFCEKDPNRFKCIFGDSGGGAKNNFMFLLKSVADAPYTMFCDQDDVWKTNKIERELYAMFNAEKDNEMVCIYSDLEVVDCNLKPIGDSFYTYTGKNPNNDGVNYLLLKNIVVGCTILMNEALRKKATAISDYSNIIMHDWWISLIAASSGKLVYVDEQLVEYRQHSNNTLGADKKMHMAWKIIKTNAYKKIYDNRIRQRRSINQARSLLPLLDKRNNHYQLVQHFSELNDKSKMYRVYFYYRYRLHDGNGIYRMLWI